MSGRFGRTDGSRIASAWANRTLSRLNENTATLETRANNATTAASASGRPIDQNHGSSRKSITFAGAFSLFSSLRSEEHTSELQSQSNLVCRLLLEKKKSRD